MSEYQKLNKKFLELNEIGKSMVLTECLSNVRMYACKFNKDSRAGLHISVSKEGENALRITAVREKLKMKSRNQIVEKVAQLKKAGQHCEAKALEWVIS